MLPRRDIIDNTVTDLLSSLGLSASAQEDSLGAPERDVDLQRASRLFESLTTMGEPGAEIADAVTEGRTWPR